MVDINEIAGYLTVPGEDDKHHDIFHAGLIDLKVVIYTGKDRKVIDMGRGFQVLANYKEVTDPTHDLAVISETTWMKLWNIAGFILESCAEEDNGEIHVKNRFWFNPVTFNAITWQIASIIGDVKYNHDITRALKGLFGNNVFCTHTILTEKPFVTLSQAESRIEIYAINNLEKPMCNRIPTVAIIIAPASVISKESGNIPLETVLLNTIVGTDFDYKFVKHFEKPDIKFIDATNPILERSIIDYSAKTNLKVVINHDSKCIYNDETTCHIIYCDDRRSYAAIKTCMNNDILKGRNQLILAPKSNDRHFSLYLTSLGDPSACTKSSDFDKYEFILRHIMDCWSKHSIIFDLVEAIFNHSGCELAKYNCNDGETCFTVLDGVKECKYVPRLIIRPGHGKVNIIISLDIIYFIDMEE